jgi:heme-degrading monooxygenase HmoA
MSVIMTLRVKGDAAKLERLASENGETLRGISERGKAAGVIAHRFYGSGDEIMVVDEWPDAESFQRFFESEQEHIGPLMQEVATGQPAITFWRKLETGDEVGWE